MSTHNRNKGGTLLLKLCVDVDALPSPFPLRSIFGFPFFSLCWWSLVVSPLCVLDSCCSLLHIRLLCGAVDLPGSEFVSSGVVGGGWFAISFAGLGRTDPVVFLANLPGVPSLFSLLSASLDGVLSHRSFLSLFALFRCVSIMILSVQAHHPTALIPNKVFNLTPTMV